MSAAPPPHREGGGRAFPPPTFVPQNPPMGTTAVTDALSQAARDEEYAAGKQRQQRPQVKRRTIDYNSHLVRWYETRAKWRGGRRGRMEIRPQADSIINYLPPSHLLDLPVSSMAMRFVHTSTNKVRCPVNTVRWTPDGRRLITGSTSGEFTLWNGLTFNFETILQAHDQAVRAMEWTHNDTWMVTGDQGGTIKYWQSNMNNLKEISAHRDPIRGIAFCPSDTKFVTASDDSTLKIWSFNDGTEERVLTGHGWDVKCVDWHPYKCLIASGGKDSLVKLWDPKVGKAITTIHGHKGTVQDIEWNKNGHWFATAGRDQLTKVYDVRMMQELQAFRGHAKEVCSTAWHPVHENLLASGGSDGSLLYWMMGEKGPVGGLETAHDSNIWSLDWHPMGHILVSGSNDHATRFWTREKPKDEEGQEGTVGTAGVMSFPVKDPPTVAATWEREDRGDALPGLSLLGDLSLPEIPKHAPQGPAPVAAMARGMGHGPPGMGQGPPGMYQGPPGMSQGPPGMQQGPPGMGQGPPGMHQGQPPSWGGGAGMPPGANFRGGGGPPGMGGGGPPGMPPMANFGGGPPGMQQGPPGMGQGPPGMNQGQPGMGQGPPRTGGPPGAHFGGGPPGANFGNNPPGANFSGGNYNNYR